MTKSTPSGVNYTRPTSHHLDKRADRISTDPRALGNPDDLLRPEEVAAWLTQSLSWLAQGRSKGYGPRFVRLSPRSVMYRREAILEWLIEREYQSTAEYPD